MGFSGPNFPVTIVISFFQWHWQIDLQLRGSQHCCRHNSVYFYICYHQKKEGKIWGKSEDTDGHCWESRGDIFGGCFGWNTYCQWINVNQSKSLTIWSSTLNITSFPARFQGCERHRLGYRILLIRYCYNHINCITKFNYIFNMLLMSSRNCFSIMIWFRFWCYCFSYSLIHDITEFIIQHEIFTYWYIYIRVIIVIVE